MVYNDRLQRFLLAITIIVTLISITACGSPANPNASFAAPTIQPISEGATPTIELTMVASLFFPQQIRPTENPITSLTARLDGTLIVDGQCLRVQDDQGQKWLPVWRWDHVLHVEQGTVSIQSTTGKTLARVGDAIGLGGGELSPSASFWQLATPSQLNMLRTCGGPYWFVSEIVR